MPNLKSFGVEDHSSARGLGRTFVSTLDTDSVKPQTWGKKGVPEYQKQLILFNLNGVETSTHAQSALAEWSLLCAGGVHEPDP